LLYPAELRAFFPLESTLAPRRVFPHGKAHKALSGRQEVLLVSPFREFNTAGLNTEREAKLRAHRIAKVSKHNGQQLRIIYDLNGAGSRIRTDDLLITNQLLYQLSYAGKYLTSSALRLYLAALVLMS
jgi:hypothetical protein